MSLPSSLADALRPTLPELSEATIAAIGREVDDYRRPLEGPFGRVLRGGVEQGLSRFVDAIAAGVPVDDVGDGTTYVQLGRGEHRAGRSLGALLGAYRIGARLAWERFATAATAAGHEPPTVYALAGAIFSYIDAISALSADGYAAEQLHAAGERARRRRALVRLLAREDAVEAEVADLAALAGWPVRETLAAIVATPHDRDHDATDAVRALGQLGTDLVAVDEGTAAIGFLADPAAPGRAAALDGLAGRLQIAVGPTEAPSRAARSLRRAQATHRLLVDGRLGDRRLARADEHLLALLLHADGALAAELAGRALGPLDALPDGPRGKLAATLRSWLDGPGQLQRIAGELDVHPQTVRYRVGRLRELFGAQLDDPEARFVLAVALRLARSTPDLGDSRA